MATLFLTCTTPLQMGFFATSQLHKDVEDSWDSTETSFSDTDTSSVSNNNTGAIDLDDIVASSQPFEDGLEDLLPTQPILLHTPKLMACYEADTPSIPLARRTRLVWRASPIKRCAIPADMQHAASRPVPKKLVRRVTFNYNAGANMPAVKRSRFSETTTPCKDYAPFVAQTSRVALVGSGCLSRIQRGYLLPIALATLCPITIFAKYPFDTTF
ncbi:hypothetical protein B0H19DRAFT_1365189 [Mycena capillaripes]|nr:hypothetical protein B0H19DRAFT_1365189 [Mycena capillaripes]